MPPDHATQLTPKEVALLTYDPADEHADEIKRFLLDASVRDLQDFIHQIQINTVGHPRYFYLARIALDIRLAEDAEKTADKLTTQTNRLVQETVKLARFTNGVFWLTLVLGGFALVQIIILGFEYFSPAR